MPRAINEAQVFILMRPPSPVVSDDSTALAVIPFPIMNVAARTLQTTQLEWPSQKKMSAQIDSSKINKHIIMNGDNKIFKIIAMIAFIAFAGVSCWSTTESLFLTLENAQIPKWVFWVSVVGLFVLTSYCCKMALDSLNTSTYMEHRKARFVIGLLGVLVLWLIFSMPTNAHTFFYKQMAKQTAVKELKHLDNELQQASDTMAYIDRYNSEWTKFDADVNLALEQLKQEINNFQNLGFGPIAQARLQDIETLLGLKLGTIVVKQTLTGTQQERNNVCQYYDNIVKQHLDVLLGHHKAKVQAVLANFQPKVNEAQALRRDIKKELNDLDNTNLDREEVLKQARQVIERAYATLESTFGGLYHPDPSIYRSDRLTKVTKVWGDYFKGRFNDTDYTLWYWILLSIIVDLAAFAFFDIAFKKDEYAI